MKCECCNEQAEWIDRLCQIHWEEYCAQSWWAMLGEIEQKEDSLEQN